MFLIFLNCSYPQVQHTMSEPQLVKLAANHEVSQIVPTVCSPWQRCRAELLGDTESHFDKAATFNSHWMRKHKFTMQPLQTAELHASCIWGHCLNHVTFWCSWRELKTKYRICIPVDLNKPDISESKLGAFWLWLRSWGFRFGFGMDKEIHLPDFIQLVSAGV